MIKNIFFKTNSEVPLFDAFTALQLITEQDYITGTDRWRHDTGRDSLAAIDPQLVELVQKQPPSKFGKAEKPSLWFAEHFFLALPALSYTFKMYGTEDPKTSKMRLNRDDLSKYFPAFPYLAKHYMEYHEFVAQFRAPSDDLWNTILHVPLTGMDPEEAIDHILGQLPPYLQEKAQQVLSGQGDSLVGRIVLAYLLEQGVPHDKLHLDAQTVRYVAPMHSAAPERSFYRRLVTAQAEMGELEPFLGRYEEEHSLLLNNFFSLITWFGRPHMVEMVIPGLAGAAEPVVRALAQLFGDIIKDGGPDYTSVPLKALPSLQKFYTTQSLEAIGRLSVVKDILSSDEITGMTDGVALRKLAAHLYSLDERKEAWGNPAYYIPDDRRQSGFTSFRQDIVDIIYSAALYAEDKDIASSENIKALKRLAVHVSQSTSFDRMRTYLQTHSQVVVGLTKDWEVRFGNHERVHIMRFVCQSFGLGPINPVPIALSEINKGFANSHLEGNMYHLCYQEANEKIEMAIPVMLDGALTATVHYYTLKPHETPHISPAGMPYSAWLEVVRSNDKAVIIPVPGRGSFDPFGRAGSAHAGEVIGFGCSVHHSSLAIILAELASLGASRGDLERVTNSFMHINQGKHERYDLAAFQLAQVIAAFENGAVYTLHDYLKDHPQVATDTSRPQLSAYVQNEDTSLSWAEPQAARLMFGHPELYPYDEDAMLDPRASWYDGKRVKLPPAKVNWHALNC